MWLLATDNLTSEVLIVLSCRTEGRSHTVLQVSCCFITLIGRGTSLFIERLLPFGRVGTTLTFVYVKGTLSADSGHFSTCSTSTGHCAKSCKQGLWHQVHSFRTALNGYCSPGKLSHFVRGVWCMDYELFRIKDERLGKFILHHDCKIRVVCDSDTTSIWMPS